MADSPAALSAPVDAMQADLSLVHALMGGTRAMRHARTALLPKFPGETDELYDIRLRTAVLFPAYGRTVMTLAGKPFSKPLTLGDDVPQDLRNWSDDIDMQGRNLHAFAADVMQTALGYGMSGILVEYPEAVGVATNAQGVRNQASEHAAGLRPYFVEIRPQCLLGWRAERRGGTWIITQLRFMEQVTEAVGPFSDDVISQVRVLTPGAWQIYRRNPVKLDEWLLHAEGATTLDFVPFVPVYGNRTGFMTGSPPLLDLAHLNVAHWQSASDQQTILHVARVPILFAKGMDSTITIGAAAAVTSTNPDADLKFVEHSGAAIGAGAADLAVLEERMRQAGAELLILAPAKGGAVTATQVASESEIGKCALQRIGQALEDSLDQALQYMATWVGLPEGGHVDIFDDFGALSLDDASAQLIAGMGEQGVISHATAFSEMQRRGVLSSDLDWDEEKARIDAQPPLIPLSPPVAPVSATEDTTYTTGGETTSPSASPPVAVKAQPPTDLQPLLDSIGALVTKLGEPDKDVPFDLMPLIDAIRSQPAPVINLPQITVEAPSIVVNVPEQPPTTVNVAPPAVTVEAAQITVEAPVITTPPVNVTIQRNGEVTFTEDDNGKITGATMQ